MIGLMMKEIVRFVIGSALLESERKPSVGAVRRRMSGSPGSSLYLRARSRVSLAMKHVR